MSRGEGEHPAATGLAQRLAASAASARGAAPVGRCGAPVAVDAWLAETTQASTLEGPLPPRELWTLVDVAEATAAERMTALASPAELAASGLKGVVTDG